MSRRFVQLKLREKIIRQSPHYAGEIWKRSFISTFRPTVHTNPLRKRSFSKTLVKPGDIENACFFIFVWTENILKTELFGNDRFTIIMHVVSLTEVSSNTNIKWPVTVAFSNSSDVVWKANIWYVFRVKPPFSNFSGAVWGVRLLTGSKLYVACNFSREPESMKGILQGWSTKPMHNSKSAKLLNSLQTMTQSRRHELSSSPRLSTTL